MAAAAAADTVAAATVATIGGATRVRTIADERGIERGTGIVIVTDAARSAGRTMIGAIADATTIMTAGVMTTTGGVKLTSLGERRFVGAVCLSCTCVPVAH